MAIEDFKSWYLKNYHESPLIMIFLTLMAVSLLTTVILSAVSGDYFLSILGDMTQHVFMDHFWSVSDSLNHPYSERAVIYPPLAVFLYYIIGRYTLPFVETSSGDQAFDMYCSQVPMIIFIVLLMASLFLLLSILRNILPAETKKWQSNLFIFLILLSFPIIIALENGNNIILIVFLILLFLRTYNSDTKWIRYASYIILGITVGFKPMPAILGLLILHEKRYAEFIHCVILVAAIALLPIFFVEGSLSMWLNNILAIPEDLGGSINNISKLFGFAGDALHITWFKTVGTAVTVAVTLLTVFLIIFDRKMKTWKLVTLASCIFILGPGVGTPYTYIYLIPALILLLTEEKIPERKTVLILILMTLPLMTFTMWLIPIKVGASIILLFWLLYEGMMDMVSSKKTSESLA